MDSNETPPAAPPVWAVHEVPTMLAGPPAQVPAPGPGPLMKSKLVLVAAAVGLVAAGGIGGFVLGQSSSATAGTTADTGRFGGGPPGMNGDGGFPGQFQGGGGPISGGTGTAP